MNREQRRRQQQQNRAAETAEAHAAAGRLKEAEAAYRKALRAEPANAALANNFANLLTSLGRLDESLPLYRRALKLDPRFAEAHANLAAALMTSGAYGEAVAGFEAAIALRPDFHGFRQALGLCLLQQGLPDTAAQRLREALALNPRDPEAHSNLLFALCYCAGESRASLAAAHREWNLRHAAHLPAPDFPGVDRAPERRLRIGYVSGDLKRHPVAFFLEPVLAARDRERFECFLYANQHGEDEFSQRLRAACDGWRSLFRVSDEAAWRQIRQDRIDVLVDLSGHTGANRLPLFALRPAPVQAAWLGYPATTGLDAIGWRVSDAIADPPDLDSALSAEKVLRLPHGFHCYRPPEAAPEPGPLPAAASERATFGCFNNLAKVSPAALALWSEVLARVPGSRLLIKSRALADPAVRARLLAEFAGRGIAPQRLELLGWTATLAEHFATYRRVDIALDSFPYAGTTTTLEALWMGVPVVTLRGETHAARVGASLLTHAGFPQWIAEGEAEYAAKAAALAGDLAALAGVRASLRVRLQASPLLDCARFAQELEAQYRGIWKEWCRKS